MNTLFCLIGLLWLCMFWGSAIGTIVGIPNARPVLLRIILWPLYLILVWLPWLVRWLYVRVFCLVRDWVRQFSGEMFRAWLGPVKRGKS